MYIYHSVLVVLGFNATLTAKVISWRSMTHMCFLAFSHKYLHNFSFQSHRLLFSHASAVVRGENTPERKVASTGDRNHNHQVMSPTRSPRSPLSHPGGACTIQRLWPRLKYLNFVKFFIYIITLSICTSLQFLSASVPKILNKGFGLTLYKTPNF